MGKISREFRLGGLSPCGKQDYPPVGNVFVFHSSVIFSHLTHVLFICLIIMFFVFFYLLFLFCAVHWVSHHIPKRGKKTKNPKSKLQNRDQKASKRVCPTSVSARPSAQQLRPQRLKHLNPLLPFSLMCCLPNFFLSSKLRCFTWNFGSWLVSPKNQDNFLFFANSPAQ